MTRNWRVVRSRAAKADLFEIWSYEIWSYIAAHDLDAADHWLAKIDAAIARLAAFPGLGNVRPELPHAVFAFSLNPHLILYTQDDTEQQVDIVRIIDARRDFGSLFL